MAHQPPGQRLRQQQIALCHRDEDVAQAVVPEARAARLADALIVLRQVRDVTERAGQGRREHPLAGTVGRCSTVGQAAFEDRCQLPCHGKLQRRARLGLLDAEDQRRQIHASPA